MITNHILLWKKKQYINQQHYFTSAAISSDFFSNLFSSNEEKGSKSSDGDIDNVKKYNKSAKKNNKSNVQNTLKTTAEKRKENNDFINSIVTSKIDFKRPPPHLWYPQARSMERTIIAHVGPTNSGKTYHAVNRLVQEKHMTGLYCAPLRLLAWETFESLNKQGCKTNLLTGQERDFPHEDARALCCTVEMAQTDYEFDIAIIDEIQMLGDFSRGASWTNALLGIQAKEIHVCGELRTIGLLEKICRETNEELIINRYDRLSELDYESEPVLNDFKNLKAGDCIVAFKRKDLFRLKNKVERTTNKKCCMVYGALPPPIRKSQATLFNTPNNNYDVLVATDAVGMGLNLAIGRVIFQSMEKYDGVVHRRLAQHEVKQIGGRAGRYKSDFPVGKVTTLQKEDRDFLTEMMAIEPKDMSFAYIEPTLENISEFAELITRMELKVPTEYLDINRTHKLVDKYQPDNFNVFITEKYTRITIRSFNEFVAIALEDLCNNCFLEQPMSSSKRGIFVTFPPERTHRINDHVVNELYEITNCDATLLHWDNISMQQILLKGTLSETKKMFEALTDLIITPNDTFLQSDIDLSRCHLSSLLPYYSECIEIDSNDEAFRFGDFREKVDVSFHLNDIRMPLELRHLLTAAPVKGMEPRAVEHFKQMVLALLNNKEVRLNIELPPRVPGDAWALRDLEVTFSMIDVYLWLSLRFPDDFVERDLAMKKAEQATRMITKYLERKSKHADGGTGRGGFGRKKQGFQNKFSGKNFINQHSGKGSKNNDTKFNKNNFKKRRGNGGGGGGGGGRSHFKQGRYNNK